MSALQDITEGLAIDATNTTLVERLQNSEIARLYIKVLILKLLIEAVKGSSTIDELARYFEEKITEL